MARFGLMLALGSVVLLFVSGGAAWVWLLLPVALLVGIAIESPWRRRARFATRQSTVPKGN